MQMHATPHALLAHYERVLDRIADPGCQHTKALKQIATWLESDIKALLLDVGHDISHNGRRYHLHRTSAVSGLLQVTPILDGHAMRWPDRDADATLREQAEAWEIPTDFAITY